MPKKEKDTTLIKPVARRLKEVIELLDYKDDLPRLSKDLGYERPDNIYNGTNGEFMPGLQLLTDLSNKFENINIGYILTGKGDPLLSNDLIVATKDPERETKEILRLRAVTNILLEYVLELRSDFHDRTLEVIAGEYEQRLISQLLQLRTEQL